VTLSKAEAAQALEQIGAAGMRMARLKGYGDAAGHMIVWGVVWLVANGVSDLAPRFGNAAWLSGIAIGSVASSLIGAARIRRMGRDPSSSALGRPANWRFGMNFLVICGFFAAMFFVIGPLSARQGNALISLFWCFAYMLAGVWIGWRIFAIGAITAVLTIFGFVALKAHFALWMGLVGGGSLIAGGLWLRRV
jgi:hypothetical protein